MNWREIGILDHNEELFESGAIGFPLVCDANVKGETAEEFYDKHK